SGPQPSRTVDLAGSWDFETVMTTVCAGGYPVGPLQNCVGTRGSQKTTIQVPGGRWGKQGGSSVSGANYRSSITIPDIGSPQVTKLVFGAVNHEATVRIDGELVGANTTSFLPSTFDLTSLVKPGASHLLTVDVKGRNALRDSAGYYTVPDAADWSPDLAQGIFRSATLEVYPAVYIADAFVRTSVAEHSLAYDVSIVNATNGPRSATLTGTLESSNARNWSYPSLPRLEVSLPPGQTTVVTVGPINWSLGPESYWWPNVPYRSGYRTELHQLVLQLSNPTDPAVVSRAAFRFGFREIVQAGDHFELNGLRVNFR